VAFLGLPAQIDVRDTRGAADTRSMAAAIHAQAATGDVIVYTEYSWSIRASLTHYLDELTWGAVRQPPDILLKFTGAQTGKLEATEVNDVQGSLAKGRRIWLVGPAGKDFGAAVDPLDADGWATQYVRYKIKYIAARYKVQTSQTFQKGRVVLLVPRTAG